MNQVFARLTQHPMQCPEIDDGARRALLRTFPYNVYYTVDRDAITVLAVLHQHRDPDTWRRAPAPVR